MIECIKKLDLKSDKNFFYLNKKINEISDLDIKFIKENYLDKDKYHLIIKNFSKSPAQMKKNIVNFSKIFGKIMLWMNQFSYYLI